MATGSYDANGIWNYGEDDNIALFADTLNKLADSTSDAFTADRGRISTLEAGSLAGLIPVQPTSIVVATGTAAVNTLGVVTFTGATSITLNNVFSSEYTNYRMVFTLYGASTILNVFGQLTTAGTPLSGTAYNRGTFVTRTDGSTLSGTGGANISSFSVVVGASNATNMASSFLDITNPYTTIRKSVVGLCQGYGNLHETSMIGTGIMDTNSRDGVKITCSTGNITGTVQIFGYNG